MLSDGFEDWKRPLLRSFSGQWVLVSSAVERSDAHWIGYSIEEIRALASGLASKDLLKRYDKLCDRLRNAGDVTLLGYESWLTEGVRRQVMDSQELPKKTRDEFQEVYGQRDRLEQHWKTELQLEEAFEETCLVSLPSADEIIARAQRIVGSPLIDPTSFVSPRLWTPYNQAREENILHRSVRQILKELREGRKELKSVKWQTLEEITAEILRSQGMEIHVVRETPQGGRDIIARGELIPGLEPITMAVEVKHKELVDRPEVQLALRQNR
ncbi:unnamed protein product, partial [marine sediment metagenome]